MAIEPTATPNDGLHVWQLMIAGSVAGSIKQMVLFPVDTVQALGSGAIKTHAFRSILQTEGPFAFYRGIAAMGLAAGPAYGVQFSVYEVCKKYMPCKSPDNPIVPAISAMCATFASEAVFTPMDTVKQRLQFGGNMYKGVWDCVKIVLREEGIGAFYASYKINVMMNLPFQMFHFITYEATKRRLMDISPHEHFVVHTAGGVAGALAAAVTTPYGVIKTQLQCQGVSRVTSRNIYDVIGAILKKDGYRGFTRGWLPRVLYHTPAAAVCWSTYEASKAFFREFNGNSNSGTVT